MLRRGFPDIFLVFGLQADVSDISFVNYNLRSLCCPLFVSRPQSHHLPHCCLPKLAYCRCIAPQLAQAHTFASVPQGLAVCTARPVGPISMIPGQRVMSGSALVALTHHPDQPLGHRLDSHLLLAVFLLGRVIRRVTWRVPGSALAPREYLVMSLML